MIFWLASLILPSSLQSFVTSTFLSSNKGKVISDIPNEVFLDVLLPCLDLREILHLRQVRSWLAKRQ